MVQYRYAFDANQSIVSAESLAGTQDRDTYHCIACERELIARVNGKVQRPHFGHKSAVECNGETYLHRLGKRAFVETFRKCQDEQTPFTISFDAPRVCNRFKPLTNRVCDIGCDHHQYDLTQYYSDLKVEQKDGEFIPDVSLHSSDRPEDVVYVEIAVTHFLSSKKENSGKRIIEIPISTEDDVEKIRGGTIDDKYATFRGFYPEIQVVPDAECNCAKKNYFAFYIFKSGKSLLDHGSLRSLQNKIHQLKDKLIWVNLTAEIEDLDDARYYSDLVPNRLFIKNLRIAQEQGVPIKNCFLCRYHGQNWTATKEHNIYCKTFRKACSSNEASTCDRYRLEQNGG